MYYVFSTLTCDTSYAIYKNTGSKDIAVIERKILIKGGHGVANSHFVTPIGVMTQVNDEDMAYLETDYHFKEHVKNGFIRIEKRKNEPEKIAANMAQKDAAAPLTPKDFEDGENSSKQVKTYKKSKSE